jgi:type IV pilus assembly protein PilB
MRKRIGDILMEMGFIDGDQLKLALMESQKTGGMVGDVLRRLGWISESDLQLAVAVQSGAKILDTEHVVVQHSLTEKVPIEFVNEHGIFPFALENDVIKAATNNPFDVIARDKLARLTGHRVETYIAPKNWIAKAIEVNYKTAETLDDEINVITYSQGTGEVTDDNRIIRLSHLLIEKGYMVGASDVHLVPDNHLVRIYYRIDGVLKQMFLFSKKFQQPLITRYKIMAELDISNPNIPHDGRIKYQAPIGTFDIRVSTFPTQLGETVVMRLLVYNKVIGHLVNLGLEPEDKERFEKIIHRPYGLILATGPTGSGKTTTLYTALMAINSPDINCMTVEDPIEYAIPTIRQTAVNVKAGLTFETALRATLRQDPDVILVGEIRDKTSADLAMRAALTGHLVLSTLHTNNAASVVNRLSDFGISNSIIASALSMVVAQRLIRLLCPHCSQKQKIDPQSKDIFHNCGLKPPIEIPKAVGCERCFQSGYRERVGIYEIMLVDRQIENLIFSGASHRQIEDAAVKAGMVLMYIQALKKVARGETSLEEVKRVIVDYA